IPVRNGIWSYSVITWDGTYIRAYSNGNLVYTSSSYNGDTPNPYSNYFGAENFNGSIADVQIYNTSLDNSTVKALYQEGIGGAPIDVTHLVGWWPLNGNANDYSGNNYQGTPTSVVWNANWQSGYSAPTS
ncbi:MAG: hypothetical protein KGH74_05645, partial [Candidatus Micrarchaeota archaeon]|nr:hypothetical protein [Candidatus Micrarchaeota archaeon]